MAIDTIPDWIRSPNTLQALSSGASAGAAAGRLEQEGVNESARLGMEANRLRQTAAMEQARLQQSAEQAQMEFQARQKAHEDNQLREQQRLQIENSYKTAALGIAKGRLEETQAAAEEKAKAAALTFQREQAFARDVAGGVPVMEAYQRNPVSSALLNSVSRTQDTNKPMHVGDAIVRRQSDGTYVEEYQAPNQRKPIKVGKNLVQVNDDGSVKVIYGPTEAPATDILGAANPDAAPEKPGFIRRLFGGGTPAAAPKPTAKDKLIRAHALGIAHPDWTKEQIIDAVNKEMP
jgi:hypothetical protein